MLSFSQAHHDTVFLCVQVSPPRVVLELFTLISVHADQHTRYASNGPGAASHGCLEWTAGRVQDRRAALERRPPRRRAAPRRVPRPRHGGVCLLWIGLCACCQGCNERVQSAVHVCSFFGGAVARHATVCVHSVLPRPTGRCRHSSSAAGQQRSSAAREASASSSWRGRRSHATQMQSSSTRIQTRII